jgi:hypothetical protein
MTIDFCLFIFVEGCASVGGVLANVEMDAVAQLERPAMVGRFFRRMLQSAIDCQEFR